MTAYRSCLTKTAGSITLSTPNRGEPFKCHASTGGGNKGMGHTIMLDICAFLLERCTWPNLCATTMHGDRPLCIGLGGKTVFHCAGRHMGLQGCVMGINAPSLLQLLQTLALPSKMSVIVVVNDIRLLPPVVCLRAWCATFTTTCTNPTHHSTRRARLVQSLTEGGALADCTCGDETQGSMQ